MLTVVLFLYSSKTDNAGLAFIVNQICGKVSCKLQIGLGMYDIRTTADFDKWLRKLKDRQAVKAIVLRLTRAEAGNLGDIKSVGGQVSEMRIFVGAGYRL